MPAVTAGVTAGAGALEYFMGQSQKNAAAKAAAANARPIYTTPEFEQQNLALAQSQAEQGMSAGARAALENNANNGLSTTAQAFMRGGASPNALSGAYNNYMSGINSVAMYDDQARQQHLNNLVSANQRASANQDKEWQINKWNPFADKAQANAQQLAAANNMQMAGLNTLGGGLAGLSKALGSTGGTPPTDNTYYHTAIKPAGFQDMPVTAPQMGTMSGSGWMPPIPTFNTGNGDYNVPQY